MDDDKSGSLEEILNQLAFVRAALEELLRRVPDLRCAYCGQSSSMHAQQFGADHDFVA